MNADQLIGTVIATSLSNSFSEDIMRTRGLMSIVVGGILFSSCGKGGPTGPSATHPALTQVASSAHFVVRAAPGDSVDTAWQEQYFEWLATALELGPAPPLEYHKYRDRAHLKALTGKETNGFAEPGTPRFHTIWPIDNHECVHTVVILQIGHPPPLFNEGVAVAHQTDPSRGIHYPRWNGTDVHVLAGNFDAAGRLPPLSSLLSSTGFFDFDTEVTYPSAGSFVRYLIDTHGLATFKTYARSATFNDSAATTQSRFQTAYGRSLASVWEEWRAALRSR
jgi:hypothetical protein